MDTVSLRQPTLSPSDQRPVGGLPSKLGPRSPRRTALASSRPRVRTDRQLAKGLGWFSIGLGLGELVAPRQVCRAIGVDDHPAVMRALGLRELAAGVGILSQPAQPAWLWSRVAGDAMDLALLAAAFMTAERDRVNVAVATAAVAGITALDVYASRQTGMHVRSQPGHLRGDGSVRVEKSIAINRPPEDCYRMWHDFEALPRFMQHLESVRVTAPGRWRWVARAPAGMSVEWDAELTNEQPGELLAWRSVEGSEIENSGAVRFLRDRTGRGTIVHVTMQYKPPAGALGAAVAKLFGEEPEIQVREDLRRFKRLVETGELPTIDGQPSGRRPAWYALSGGSNR